MKINPFFVIIITIHLLSISIYLWIKEWRMWKGSMLEGF